MNPARHLALWLAAMIVAIVVSLAPSAAAAHGSHDGGYGHEGHGSVAQERSVAADIFADRASDIRRPVPAFAAAARGVVIADAASDSLGCSGPCCVAGGHASSCCCAIGLAPAAEAEFLLPLPRRREPAGNMADPRSLAPEALPEPPRSFA